MTTQASVEGFLAENTLAIAGVSRHGKGFGNAVLKDLTAKGYEILPVHPEAEEVGGVQCSPSIDAVHGECIMMFAKPTGIHRFHRWLWGVLGKLPSTNS
jgi:predicted CoA-binding protein